MKINQYGNPTPVSAPGKAEERRIADGFSSDSRETVNISREARHLELVQAKLAGEPEVRPSRVEEARLALGDGSLDSDPALEQALDRLIPDLI